MNLLQAEREESMGRKPQPVQDILGAQARASLVAQQRTQELVPPQGSASAAEMTPAERQAARMAQLRQEQAKAPSKAPAVKAPGVIGAAGTRSPDGRPIGGTRSPDARNPGTPGRQRRSSRSPPRDRRRRG